MARFRKRPVEVDAMQFTGDNDMDIMVFIVAGPGGDRSGWQVDGTESKVPAHRFVWDYLHDTWVRVNPGDWVIRGVHGEHYPCNEGVFGETYEAI